MNVTIIPTAKPGRTVRCIEQCMENDGDAVSPPYYAPCPLARTAMLVERGISACIQLKQFVEGTIAVCRCVQSLWISGCSVRIERLLSERFDRGRIWHRTLGRFWLVVR